jgi:hypothetical protein
MLRSAATECWVGLVFSSPLGASLADRLQERQRLDVAHRAADLGDHHVGGAAAVSVGHRADAGLDLVGDVRDDLNGVAEVLAAPLLGDHRRVDLAGGDIRVAAEVAVEEPLVVPDVEVGFRAVLGDEHLAVLERVHRSRIDVQIGVELLHHDAQAACGEEIAQAGSGEPFAEGGGDAPGDEDVLGRLSRNRSIHGTPQ